MRSDITPGGVFPDHGLPDPAGAEHTLSALPGKDPLILVLAAFRWDQRAGDVVATG